MEHEVSLKKSFLMHQIKPMVMQHLNIKRKKISLKDTCNYLL